MSAPTSAPGATHSHWSSRFSFLMASIGFAIGLGNIWRFPYLTGENGGSAFVLVYLCCAFGIGVPLMMTELMIGRRGGMSVIGSLKRVAAEANASSKWSWIGVVALLSTFMIEVYYIVIAGWTLDYLVQAVTGGLSGLTAEQSVTLFDSLLDSPLRLAFWSGALMFITAFTVGRGLHGGIEKAVNFLMPSLLIALVLLVIYASIVGNFGAAIDFLFAPDFSKIKVTTVLVAIGQAFFSIGIGFGTLVTYGAYLGKDVSIAKSAFTVVSADTGVALLAGLAIFPIVFGFGMEPSSGEGLVFETLPVAFATLPGGQIVSTLFFFLLFSAAITSCIGNFEPLIAWAEEHKGMPRSRAAAIGGGLIWLLSWGTVLSYNYWEDFHPLSFLPLFKDSTIYGVQDFISANMMLPLGATATAIFAGWIMSRKMSQEEIGLGDGLGYKLWRISICYVAPIAILSVLVTAFIG